MVKKRKKKVMISKNKISSKKIKKKDLIKKVNSLSTEIKILAALVVLLIVIAATSTYLMFFGQGDLFGKAVGIPTVNDICEQGEANSGEEYYSDVDCPAGLYSSADSSVAADYLDEDLIVNYETFATDNPTSKVTVDWRKSTDAGVTYESLAVLNMPFESLVEESPPTSGAIVDVTGGAIVDVTGAVVAGDLCTIPELNKRICSLMGTSVLICKVDPNDLIYKYLLYQECIDPNYRCKQVTATYAQCFAPPLCTTSGEMSCYVDYNYPYGAVEFCDSYDHRWIFYSCDSTERCDPNSEPPACNVPCTTPDAVKCENSVFYKCANSYWEKQYSCPYGCVGSECATVGSSCTYGVSGDYCSNYVLYVCESDNKWHLTFCNDGVNHYCYVSAISGEGFCASEGCFDLDERDYFIKGRTIINGESAGIDACTDTTTLNEYYCDGASSSSETIACEYGCLDGACLQPECISDADCPNGNFCNANFACEHYTYEDGEPCTDDTECLNNNCDADFDEQSAKYCHATASSCVDGPGANEYADGLIHCFTDETYYKTCTNSLWGSQEACDTNYICDAPSDSCIIETKSEIIKDYSTFINHGTIFGNPQLVTGQDSIGSAYQFDGIDDYIEIPNNAALNPEEITVSAWVNFNSLTDNNRGILSKMSTWNSDHAYSLLLNAGAYNFVFVIPPECDGSLPSVNSISSTTEAKIEGGWYHVVGTYKDGDKIKIYVNGILEAEAEASGIICPTSTANVIIGALGNTPMSFIDGAIDDVKIYPFALPEEQITQIFADANPAVKTETALAFATSTNSIWQAEVTASTAGREVITTTNILPIGEDIDNDGYIAEANGGTDCDDNPSDDGAECVSIDCNDPTFSKCAECINLEATEVCDGIDNDCQDGIDESCDCSPPGLTQECGTSDTFPCQKGTQTCQEDYIWDECDGNIEPTLESCDGIDNDCNGEIDDGVKTTYYFDSDGDGYGDITVSIDACSAPEGYVEDNTDCDDTTALRNPGEEELCDGIDNDCDAATLDGQDENWYEQPTACGVGACASTGSLICSEGVQEDTCEEGSPLSADDETCDGVDDDCSGTADEDYIIDNTCGIGYCNTHNTPSSCIAGVETICQAEDPLSENDETCDGVDDDCSGTADEDYVVSDTTCGLGVCVSTGTKTCSGGTEIDSCVANPQDEPLDITCDGLDGDCDGTADEDYVVDNTCGIGYCNTHNTPSSCIAGVETICQAEDPLSENDETCDGIDDNCNGEEDEDYVETETACGLGKCESNTGLKQCIDGIETDTCNPFEGAVTETCEDETGYDGVDNNCDGAVDLNCDSYCDQDEDDYSPHAICAIAGYSLGDCDDTDILRNPGEEELCDGIDNDCDAATLDGQDETWYDEPTSCGIGACAANGMLTCTGGLQEDTCNPWSPSADDSLCNGIDDDCDGQIDEEYASSGTTCGLGVCSGNTGTLSCILDSEVDSCEPFLGLTTEICDGLDNDCDGETDEGCDDDNDDYCDSTMATIGTPDVCLNGGNDCNDNPVNDGAECPTEPSDVICNDLTYSQCAFCINPGAIEVCDGVNNDCDALLDGSEGLIQQCGSTEQGLCTLETETCNDIGEWVGCNAIFETEEICDGEDNDCDGNSDEGCDSDLDGYIDAAMACNPGFTCVNDDGFEISAEITCNGCDLINRDCEDDIFEANPGQDEICANGIDDDCSGEENNGCEGWCNSDGDLSYSPVCIWLAPNDDCDDSDSERFPGNDEVCDLKDNNCDALEEIDEGFDIKCAADTDCAADGCIEGTYYDFTCNQPGTCLSACLNTTLITDADGDGYDIECEGDYDDNDNEIYPGATEWCDDGKDNDGDGRVDGADECTQKPSVQSSGGGGGGGGGGSGGGSSSESAYLGIIKEGESKTGTFTKAWIHTIVSIEIFSNKDSNNVRTEARKTTKPLGASDPISIKNGKTFKFVKLAKVNLRDEDMEKAVITFRVEKTWFTENNLDKDTVVFYHYVNRNWIPLATKMIKEDAEEVYYASETNTFSIFAIAAQIAKESAVAKTEPAKTTTPTQVQTVQSKPKATTPAPKQVISPETALEEPVKEKSNILKYIMSTIIMLVVVAGILAYTVAYRKKRVKTGMISSKKPNKVQKINTKKLSDDDLAKKYKVDVKNIRNGHNAIIENRKKGFDDDSIRKAFLQKGWPKTLLEEILNRK